MLEIAGREADGGRRCAPVVCGTVLLVRLSARGVDCCRPRRRPKPRGLRCLWKPSSARPVLARRKARPSGRCATTACGLPIRPVLKHGPRSLTCARVIGLTKPKGEMKVKAEHLCWCRGRMVGPEWPTRTPGASRSH